MTDTLSFARWSLSLATTRVESTRKNLTESMRSLAIALEQAAKQTETGCKPNGFGEIQGVGPEIDALCGTLAAEMEAEASWRAMVERLEAVS